MSSLSFPDVNVWLALSSPDHMHFASAWKWYSTLPDQTVLMFCRHTQLGMMRLLTTQSVMGLGTLTQAQTWDVYDRWLEAGGVEFAMEPKGLDSTFRSLTAAQTASPKDWADSYLAAFSSAADVPLITFDKALAEKAKRAVLLT